MSYDIIKLVIYIVSVVASMYGLNCIDFQRYIKKNHVLEFYVFYVVLSFALAYLIANFILSFMMIRIG